MMRSRCIFRRITTATRTGKTNLACRAPFRLSAFGDQYKKHLTCRNAGAELLLGASLVCAKGGSSASKQPGIAYDFLPA